MEKEQPFSESPMFAPFLSYSAAPDFHAVFREVSELPPIPQKNLFEERRYRVHPDGKGGFLRSFFDSPLDLTPYGVGEYDYDNGSIRIDYLAKGARFFTDMHNSFFHLGLESILLHRQRMCLHASFIQTELGGILFSGPSGVGKSTQAELWCKYRNARQINGDRPILSKAREGWLAWGSPYAGSSKCYVNASCPVAAVVMLRQAENCTLRRLTAGEAFRRIWSGLTMHSWDPYCVETACDLTLDLVGAVPVYELGCTPDEQAVACLEQGLRKELRL